MADDEFVEWLRSLPPGWIWVPGFYPCPRYRWSIICTRIDDEQGETVGHSFHVERSEWGDPLLRPEPKQMTRPAPGAIIRITSMYLNLSDPMLVVRDGRDVYIGPYHLHVVGYSQLDSCIIACAVGPFMWPIVQYWRATLGLLSSRALAQLRRELRKLSKVMREIGRQ